MHRQQFGVAAAIILGLVLPGLALAQVAPRAADLVGTWESTVGQKLSTAASDSVARHPVQWLQFSQSHWTTVQIERDRAVVSRAADRPQVCAARGGTYRVDGGVVYLGTVVALQPRNVGRIDTLTVVRLSGTELVLQTAPDADHVRWEHRYRRID